MLSALQGGKLDDITVVMALVDEEDVHVVRAQLPESEEEDTLETLVSDSEGGVPPEPAAEAAVPAGPTAPTAREAVLAAPAAPAAEPSAASPPAASAAIAAPAGSPAALSNGHVAAARASAAGCPCTAGCGGEPGCSLLEQHCAATCRVQRDWHSAPGLQRVSIQC